MPISTDAASPWIQDATRENFPALVLENSARGPVLVNFWSPATGPCLRQYPVLDQLVNELGGKFILVNLNIGKHGRLAREWGVTSVPTLKLFRRGDVVETLHGYQSESGLRALLTRHVARDSDATIASALKAHQGGYCDQALSTLARAGMEDPDNPRIPLTLAKLLIREGRLQQAQQILAGVPAAAGIPESAEIERLTIHVAFLRAAEDAPPTERLAFRVEEHPEDLGARFRLAAVSLASDDYETALEQLLEIQRRDAVYEDRIAARGMQAIFQLLGNEGALVDKYRTDLRRVVH
jgi:putative thioredoxin